MGIDVATGVTKLAQSRNDAFSTIDRPNIWEDIRMLNGLFRLYSKLLSLYKIDIRLWRHILPNKPQLGTPSKNYDMELMHNLWNK